MTIPKITLAWIAALFLATGTAHAEPMEQYCKGHWTDPRKEYEECVLIRGVDHVVEVGGAATLARSFGAMPIFGNGSGVLK